MRATGVGSLPGEDFAGAVRFVLDTFTDLPYLPELPARGDGADMIGRTVALLADLGADLQPAGWRLTDRPGLDQRRARSLLAHDLDVLEEELQDFAGPLKVQVAGPWTLAATVERPRGDRVLADHGARRELAQSLAAGVGEHVSDVRRRVRGAEVVVQVDEPALRAVLDAQVPTASGYGRHRRVDLPQADAALREVTEAVVAAGAAPVVHSCAAGVPIALLAGAGFGAVSFDLGLVAEAALDELATAFEQGVDMWPGIGGDDPTGLRKRADAFFAALGFAEGSWEDRAVLTSPCGLAGTTPDEARRLSTDLAKAAQL